MAESVLMFNSLVFVLRYAYITYVKHQRTHGYLQNIRHDNGIRGQVRLDDFLKA